MHSSIIVADTSILINFLKIDRMDLIGAYPRRCLTTEHLKSEIEEAYPEQNARYQSSLAAGFLETCVVTDLEEVALFTRLSFGQRLGAGECSAIAVALHRGLALGIDDNRAVNRALKEAGLAGTKLEIVRTQDIIVNLVQIGALDISTADTIKDARSMQHRFKLKITSFVGLL